MKGTEGRFRIGTLPSILIGVVLLALAAGAYAYWTGSGEGTGTATVGTSSAVTLNGTVEGTAAPGTTQVVSFTAANPSDSPVQVTTVHLDSVTVDGVHAACETGDFTMADVGQGGGHEVPAGATTEELPNNGSLVFANTAVSQDACKGATLTLHLSSS